MAVYFIVDHRHVDQPVNRTRESDCQRKVMLQPTQQLAVQESAGPALAVSPDVLMPEIAGSGYAVAPQSTARFPKYSGMIESISGEAVPDAFPDSSFAFEIGRISPVVSAAKATVRIRLILNAPR